MPVPQEAVREGLSTPFSGCLVEGDAEQRAREKRMRRRALGVSLLLQAAALAAVILVPLFWNSARRPAPQRPSGGAHSPVCTFCQPNVIPNHPPTANPGSRETPGDPNFPLVPDGPGVPWGRPDGVPFAGEDTHRLPPPVQTTRRIQVAKIEPAMLVRRVEPVYPPLARQIHRSGRVELRAVIATDGTIQSLQMVGGDPFFYLSARDAVLQWRYRPTLLNGQVVEVETIITVIYQMQ